MKIIDKMENYLEDHQYKITIKNNQVDIINYQEIINFTTKQISIMGTNKVFIIEGQNLVISEMIDNEILINGIITNIRIN